MTDKRRKKLMTLVLVIKDQHILLGMKKRGFGAGRWNGFGGKVKPGESIRQAAKREVHEEAGVNIESLEKVGVLDFRFQGQNQLLQVHIFSADQFSGQPRETEEMKPRWFKFSEIPYQSMWPDDQYWLPWLIEGKKFEGKFLFGLGDKILRQKIRMLAE